MHKTAAKRILDYMDDRIGQTEDPRLFGKALTGPLGDYWRYRIGDYRIVCDIQDQRVVVQVVRVGHRREVYDD